MVEIFSNKYRGFCYNVFLYFFRNEINLQLRLIWKMMLTLCIIIIGTNSDCSGTMIKKIKWNGIWYFEREKENVGRNSGNR